MARPASFPHVLERHLSVLIASIRARLDLIRRYILCVPRVLRLSMTKVLLLCFCCVMLAVSLLFPVLSSNLLAASARSSCGWHVVANGDTLTRIARQYHTAIATLLTANSIHNPNLIFVGQRLCIPHAVAHSRGVQANGTIHWYDYKALDWSNRRQVHDMLSDIAARHHLPARLVLAIAWQESGWTQHVIAWDGGIGVMQLMPYTAMNINMGMGQQLDPYQLWDNVNLGATYLAWLWQEFHGNLSEVISGYNEGGWAVQHRGIFNWQYVNNVLALMQTVQ